MDQDNQWHTNKIKKCMKRFKDLFPCFDTGKYVLLSLPRKTEALKPQGKAINKIWV